MFVFLFSHWLLLVARVPLPYVHLPSPLSSSPMCSSSLHFLNHWNRMPGEVNCKELNGVKKPMVRKTTERNTAGERVYGPVSSFGSVRFAFFTFTHILYLPLVRLCFLPHSRLPMVNGSFILPLTSSISFVGSFLSLINPW